MLKDLLLSLRHTFLCTFFIGKPPHYDRISPLLQVPLPLAIDRWSTFCTPKLALSESLPLSFFTGGRELYYNNYINFIVVDKRNDEEYKE